MTDKRKQFAPGIRQGGHSAKAVDLLSKEEEYRRINEELEARTAALVNEADSLMRSKDSFNVHGSFLENACAEDILNELDDFDKDSPKEREVEATIPSHKTAGKSSKIAVKSRGGKKAEGVATGDDAAFLTDLRARVVAVAEAHQADEFSDDEAREEAVAAAAQDVLPAAAADMGTEAQNRFLKAKLRVMQEDNEKLLTELYKKTEECTQLGSRVKEVEEERNRLHRTNTAQQSQIDKYKKLAEDYKSKADTSEGHLQAIRKDLDSTKRNLDQQGSSTKAQAVRLNRALEEAEKAKAALSKTKTEGREATEAERRRVDQLLAENKRLEKQKSELIAGFKKQMRLIDILKRQRMHIEAAKMLQFSEEEFVKALDWAS